MASTEPPVARPPSRSVGLALKVPPVALVGLAAAIMWRLPDVRARPALGEWTSWLGAALAFLGVVIALAGVLAFRQRRTTVDPTCPEAASALVMHGVYRFTRNPMYLGFVMLLGGWALHLGTISSLLVIPLVAGYLTVFQIKPEEFALRQHFGAEFDAYAARVRRWL